LRLLGLLMLLCAPGQTWSQSALAPEELSFFTKSKYAIVIDARTGRSIYEKDADVAFPPASMSKLMTMIMVFEKLADRSLTLEQEFIVSKNAWKKGGAKSGGSTMYLEPESRVKLGDLIQGAIVQSANDACIVIAEGLVGTEEGFADLMTFRAREMGLKTATFKNATGLHHPEHKMTARELALLAEYIIRRFPQYYGYYRQAAFTWNNITQQNRNPLLTEYPGADGLKTGFVKESGYGLVGSAIRNERRLIIVVAGLESAAERREEAQKLLDWGFRQFKPYIAYGADETVGQARVWGGTVGAVPLVTNRDVKISLSAEESKLIKVEMTYKGPLIAPISKNTELGRVRFTILGKTIADMPLYSSREVAATDSNWKKAFDSILIMALGG
jgi:D-alanyl-D-alanine carboxypeptidase (penicillin-binding protein 5/6)